MSIVKLTKDGKRFVKYVNNKAIYYERDKPELSDFFQEIKRPIAVIGSSPTVWEDVEKLPPDCMYFAINHHWLKPNRLPFAWLAYLDNPGRPAFKSKRHYYEDFDGVRFCNQMEWTDINIVKEEPLIIGDSGIFALWIALYMTTERVYACGFNNRKPGVLNYHPDSNEVKEAGNWVNPDVSMKFGRWAMLMDSAHKPERLTVFDEGIAKFLQDRNYTFYYE